MVGRHDRASRDRLEVVPGLAPALEHSSEQLLEQVAGGDEAAFGLLYQRVGGIVFGLARAVLRDPRQVEEVLLEVWRTAPRYDATKGSARAACDA